MKTEKTTLTEKETEALNAFRKGMDEPNCGWLHEMYDNGHTTSGVVSSLIKKKVITSEEEFESGMPVCFWITVLDPWKE